MEILLHVLIATVLCGIIGFERESLDKPAGLRTNMIIGGASCFIASLSFPLIAVMEAQTTTGEVTLDPIRLLHALVVGVSFIGAGTIIKASDDQISGLTTAATLLYSMAIGVSIAIKEYVVAAGVTIIVLIINFAVRKIQVKLSNKKEDKKREI